MYGIIATLFIIAFIFYFNTGNKNILFGSIIAFLVFLSTHISYKHTGRLQSALRNSIFIGIVTYTFLYLLVFHVIGMGSPIFGMFLNTYIVSFFSFLILKPPLVDNRLKRMGTLKCILVMVLPLPILIILLIISLELGL